MAKEEGLQDDIVLEKVESESIEAKVEKIWGW